MEEGQQGRAMVEDGQDTQYWANLGAEPPLGPMQLPFLSTPRHSLDTAQNPQADSSRLVLRFWRNQIAVC